MKTIRVSSAFITDDTGRLLLLRRGGSSKHFQGTWQLPEGKIDTGEKPEETIIRELAEELDAQPVQCDFISRILAHAVVDGDDIAVERHLFYVSLDSPRIRLSTEHTEYAWHEGNAFDTLTFYPGTLEAIQTVLTTRE